MWPVSLFLYSRPGPAEVTAGGPTLLGAETQTHIFLDYRAWLCVLCVTGPGSAHGPVGELPPQEGHRSGESGVQRDYRSGVQCKMKCILIIIKKLLRTSKS